MKAPRRAPKPQPPGPLCCECGAEAVLRTGAEVYPQRPDLAGAHVWECPACLARVGCRGATKKPLGRPAGPELRRARALLRERIIDPLWQTADTAVGYFPEDERARHIIRSTARARVTAFLADRLGVEKAACSPAEFDLATCRRAWRLLSEVTYAEIRAWARKQKEQQNGNANRESTGAHIGRDGTAP